MIATDILVVGGGPAGLLTAGYLAISHHVALVERGLLGQTTKYWVTTHRRLSRHGLSDCVLKSLSAMVVGTFLGGRVVAPGDLAVVDERKLLGVLIERCNQRGVLLSERHTLLNLAWKSDRVIAETDRESYSARLVIDASGTGSPIAETFRLHRLDGYLSVYGAHLKKIQLHTPNMILAYVNFLGDPPPFLEVIPTGDDSAYCTVFKYSRKLLPPATLDGTYQDQIRCNPFFSFTNQSEQSDAKIGAIAIGSRRRRQLAGVIGVGEAGLVQPPLLGSAFNEVLQHSAELCAHVTVLLEHSDGVPKAPGHSYPIIKRLQDRIQLGLARVLLDGNVETFDRVLRFLQTLPPGIAYDFCSNELGWPQLLSAALHLPGFIVTGRGPLTYP